MHCAARGGATRVQRTRLRLALVLSSKIFGPGATVKGVSLTTTGSLPGAEVSTIDVLKPDVCITSFKHVHSGALGTTPDPDFPQNLINPVREPRVDQLFPPKPPPARDTRTTGVGGGGSVSTFYQFTVKDSQFSFIWHDTGGPLKERAPNVLQMQRDLPKADVELGSIVSSGETINGVRDGSSGSALSSHASIGPVTRCAPSGAHRDRDSQRCDTIR